MSQTKISSQKNAWKKRTERDYPVLSTRMIGELYYFELETL